MSKEKSGSLACFDGKIEGYRKNPEVPLNVYIEDKIAMLRNDFYINISAYDLEHLRKSKTEREVDLYVRQLFNERL